MVLFVVKCFNTLTKLPIRSLKDIALIRKERFKTIHKVNLLVEVVKLHFKFTFSLSNESFMSQIVWNCAHIYSFTKRIGEMFL